MNFAQPWVSSSSVCRFVLLYNARMSKSMCCTESSFKYNPGLLVVPIIAESCGSAPFNVEATHKHAAGKDVLRLREASYVPVATFIGSLQGAPKGTTAGALRMWLCSL